MSLPEPYYDHAGITIFHGDCRSILPDIPAGSVDLVLTDPPYGIDLETHGQNFASMLPIRGDSDNASYEWLDSYESPLAAFFSPYNPPLIKWRSVLIWQKGEHVGGGADIETCWKRDTELVGVKRNRALNGKRDSSVLRFNSVSPPPTGHVAEKPIRLMLYLVGKLTQPCDLILDPFMGSGTTLVAAKQLGRRAIGIEIEEKYCEIAVRRLAQEVLPLEAPEPEPKQGDIPLEP